MRSIADIRAELDADGTAPRRKGECRVEMIQAQEAELVKLREALDKKAEVVPATAPPLEVTPEDRKALATQLIVAMISQYGTNFRQFNAVIDKADDIYDVFEKMLAGGGREPMFMELKKIRDERDALIRERAANRNTIKDLTEKVTVYKQNLEALGAPV